MREATDELTVKPDRAEKRIRKLEKTVRQLTSDELSDRQSFRRLLVRNFVAGLVRGGGTVIGIALLGTVLVFLLKYLAESNMEGLSEFIAELLRWVQRSL